MNLPIKYYVNKKIFKNYTGLSFFIFIWIYKGRRRKKSIEKTIIHEIIHYKQQLELGFIFGFLVWGILMLRSLILYKDKAYRNHPWEREAYDNQDDVDYLKNRKVFAWVKYLNK